MHNKNHLPIGIFDSGIGGLTVLKSLQEALPDENFLYLGDTARLPYGTKSQEIVCQYALNANELLHARGIKALVIACHTATGFALEALQARFSDILVAGVILPSAQACLNVQDPGPILVIATEGTVKGHAYKKIIKKLAPERLVIEWPCSLMVALAEEGWCDGALVEQVIAKILEPVLKNNIKPACIVLGCTHFPVLRQAIQNVAGKDLLIIDPAQKVAQIIKQYLIEHSLLRESNSSPNVHFMATDGVERFARVAQTFLGVPVVASSVELVHVPNFAK